MAVRAAEGFIHAGSEGGHTVREGRAWAWGPQTAKAQPYAALLALLVPSVAEPPRPRRGAEVWARHEGGANAASVHERTIPTPSETRLGRLAGQALVRLTASS